MHTMNTQERELFLETVWTHYDARGRHELPWRLPEADGTFDPHKIMVSELMLQQTQVARVIPKYEAFLAQFPTPQALAGVELGDVLRAWQGLGYNRRAKFLWQAAQMIGDAQFPDTAEALIALPGIGKNTAGAILAYAYNQPAIFIETNIRTVYIHHFFVDQEAVSDAVIADMLSQTIDSERPREFYWALMDYGAWLKAQVRNNAQSKHYAKQSKFEGSRRQIRGQVIRALTTGACSVDELRTVTDDVRLQAVLDDLVGEGMIRREGVSYTLA